MSAVAAVTERIGIGAQVLCQSFSYDGAHVSVDRAVNVPSPSRRIPIGVGCTGDRMLDVTARLADEWNYPATGLDRYDERRRIFDERAAACGREVRRSTQIVFAPGDRAVPPFLQMFKPQRGIRGSRSQMVDRVGQLADLGLSGFCGFVPDDHSLDAMAESLPDLRAVGAARPPMALANVGRVFTSITGSAGRRDRPRAGA